MTSKDGYGPNFFGPSFNKEANIAQKTELRSFFNEDHSEVGELAYTKPERINGKVVVRPLIEVVEEDILESATSLVGQVLDKPLPFLLIKNTIENLWR